MQTRPDTITLTGSHRVEVAATHADVLVTIRGSSAVGSGQAVTKAKEVSDLVADVKRLGIGEDRVQVIGVSTQSVSGRVTRSSAASYSVSIRTETLDQVPRLLDVIASQRNAGVDRVVWRYPEEAGREEALVAAIAQARAKAALVAQSLGVELLGVHEFSENGYDEEPDGGLRPPMMRTAAASEAPSLDFDVMHRRVVHVGVSVTSRVSG